MPTWNQLTLLAPELCADALRFFDANKHKTIATIRADGGPRISGTEILFSHGDVVVGSMRGSRKSGDLTRDPRCAIHSASRDPGDDGSGWHGDAKLTARARLVTDASEFDRHRPADAPADYDMFCLDITELVVTQLEAAREQLTISYWTETGGLKQIVR